MRMISEQELTALREEFPRGSRIELVQMNDILSRILDKISYQYF